MVSAKWGAGAVGTGDAADTRHVPRPGTSLGTIKVQPTEFVAPRPMTNTTVTVVHHMRQKATRCGLGVAFALAVNPSLGAQSACLTSGQSSTALANYITSLVTATDSATIARRNRYGLPALPSSAVTVVTDSATCRGYADAYSAIVNPSAPMVGRRVYVVQAGSTRAVILDPNQKAGEWRLEIIFDTNRNKIAMILGG